MSKAVTCPVILTSASTRSDGSLGIRFATPELTPVEKAAVFELQGINLQMTLAPLDTDEPETVEVKGELSEKTPSQRLRSILFVLWRQQSDQPDFETFYRLTMNKIIERAKEKLNPT